MDKIRVDYAAFNRNSSSFMMAISNLAMGSFTVPPSNTSSSRSDVLDDYRTAAQDLYNAIRSYKHLLIRDYQILQNVYTYLSQADKA